MQAIWTPRNSSARLLLGGRSDSADSADGSPSICCFICFRQQWLDVGWRHSSLHFYNHIDQPELGGSGVREERNCTFSADSPPGKSRCSILDYPTAWRSWKHFSSLRAYLFIDYPKGGGVSFMWSDCHVFYVLRVLWWVFFSGNFDNNANKT